MELWSQTSFPGTSYYIIDTGLLHTPSLVDCCISTICVKPGKFEELRNLSDDLLQRMIAEWQRISRFKLPIVWLLTNSNLQRLYIPANPHVTDRWLDEVAKIVSLRELDLSFCTQLTENALRSISNLVDLQRLVVTGTQVRKADVLAFLRRRKTPEHLVVELGDEFLTKQDAMNALPPARPADTAHERHE